MTVRERTPRPRRRAWSAWALLPCALALAACQGHAPAGRAAPPAVTPTIPSGPKVVVVDFDKVVHAHPRWADVNALDQRIARLEGQLSAVSPQMQLPQINLEPQLQATAQQEVANARPQFQQQFTETATALRTTSQKELAAFVTQVRQQQQVQFDAQQKALTDQVQKAIADKQTELNQDTAQFQQQMLEQYRLPLVNLQLKQTALQGAGDRQQLAAVAQQIAALTAERDGKIDAHEKANQQALADFQKQQQDSYSQQIKDLEAQLSAQGQQQIDAKQAELEKAFRDQMTAKQTQLNDQMNTQIKAQVTAREQALVAGARDQMARAQQQAIAGAQAQVQSLRAQLGQAEAERARLLGSILADVRIEAATLAAEQGYDVILTRAVASVDVPDVTTELIARIKR